MYTLRESLPQQRNKFKINKTLLLILSLTLLYLFVSLGLPFLSQLAGPGFQASHQTIIEEEIPAGEWFYIFVPQIRDIEPRIRHTLEYTPGMTVDK